MIEKMMIRAEDFAVIEWAEAESDSAAAAEEGLLKTDKEITVSAEPLEELDDL